MADPVIVYSGPGCADCQRVKELLTNKGVDFETRDVFANKAYREDVEKLGFMGIPVTVVGGRAIKGFDKEALLELLAGR
ncbi:glutaredoxin family protein [Paenibacillus sp. MBLB4367]|uniref:glutaredoxin family protein n=1 Tax=Paenibacillus sp. MBLB4367 TaxID=3384767 RepID=UPI003907FD86